MLILGSNSQGRKLLLSRLTNDLVVIPSDYNEDELKSLHLKPSTLVKKLSYQKLKVLMEKYPDETIICADTVVYQKGLVYGKPTSRQNAYEMLYQLSRSPHYVYSGASIYLHHKVITFYDKTKVIFNKLTSKDINSYLDTNDYLGKAGSYGIQSLNDTFIKKIVGGMDTIIGIPLQEVQRILLEGEKNGSKE